MALVHFENGFLGQGHCQFNISPCQDLHIFLLFVPLKNFKILTHSYSFLYLYDARAKN